MLVLDCVTHDGRSIACKTRGEVCSVLKTGSNASATLIWERHDKVNYIVAAKYQGDGQVELYVTDNSLDANLAFAGQAPPKNPPLFGGIYDGVVFEPAKLKACVIEYIAAAKEKGVI